MDLDGVAATAFGVARARAVESARPDALFHDPYAARFVEAGGEPGRDVEALDPAERRQLVAMYHWIVARTRFLDDVCADAAPSVEQVVVLGAGLDTRAFRLDWPPSTSFFELDRSEVLAAKERVLSDAGAVTACRRIVVDADLTGDWPRALADAGLVAGRRTLWLAEGLFVYLEAAVVADILTTWTELSAPGSRAGVTVGRDRRTGNGSTGRSGGDVFADLRGLWHDHSALDVPGRLAAAGWQVATTTARDVLAAAGRVPAGPPAAGASAPRLVGARLG